jgi:hypothetical protein
LEKKETSTGKEPEVGIGYVAREKKLYLPSCILDTCNYAGTFLWHLSSAGGIEVCECTKTDTSWKLLATLSEVEDIWKGMVLGLTAPRHTTFENKTKQEAIGRKLSVLMEQRAAVLQTAGLDDSSINSSFKWLGNRYGLKETKENTKW